MKLYNVILCAAGILSLANRAEAQTLYGATSGSSGGELYILNPTTGGVVQDVGAMGLSMSGLAFDPLNGTLYGSTGGQSGTELVTINPTTAAVTIVGLYGAGSSTMTDLAFDQSGNLYGISSSGGANLYSINTATGHATLIGTSGVPFTQGGGLAISTGGVYYGAPIPGDYGTYDPITGAYTQIATPASPAGSGGGYAALAFNNSGTLYGDNLVAGSGGGASHLVTIDPTTGNVTDLGASVAHLDALAFTVPVVPEPNTFALLGVGALGLVFMARKK